MAGGFGMERLCGGEGRGARGTPRAGEGWPVLAFLLALGGQGPWCP